MVEIVLESGQFLADQTDMVIVEQRDGASHQAVRLYRSVADKLRPDQIAKRL